jgi:hypothetical protein
LYKHHMASNSTVTICLSAINLFGMIMHDPTSVLEIILQLYLVGNMGGLASVPLYDAAAAQSMSNAIEFRS